MLRLLTSLHRSLPTAVHTCGSCTSWLLRWIEARHAAFASAARPRNDTVALCCKRQRQRRSQKLCLRRSQKSRDKTLSSTVFLPALIDKPLVRDSVFINLKPNIRSSSPSTVPLATPANVNSPVLSHFSLAGKTSAVTGGARGLGLEVVRALAEAGASVALINTSSRDAEATAKKISEQTGQKVVAYKSDVRSKEAITNTINQIASDFGTLDIVVANAGIASHYDSLEYTEDQWREIMNVNLDGAMFTAQAAGNIFKKQKEAGGKGDGSFIFTASVSATLVNVPQKQAAYNASKAAVVHLAKCLAVEWVEVGRVNSISPGFVETEMIGSHPKAWRDKWSQLVPAGRNADPAELKGAYVFLASNASSYMTGANIVIDGGYTLP